MADELLNKTETQDEPDGYSVLMPVYGAVKPEHLRESIESILRQSVPTDDFVLVCDGPLTEALDAVVAEAAAAFAGRMQVIRLERNEGAGHALMAGLEHCRHELVARMDSDDVSRPDRCERQLAVFRERPDCAIVSGTVEEFGDDVGRPGKKRVLPEDGAALLDWAKKRNPFNHPCVMYRKSAVLAAGGYQDFYLLEDYYLWVRMLRMGYTGCNIQEPLLWMRAGDDLYRRRSGWRYAESQRKLLRYMRDVGFIDSRQYLVGCVVRTVVSVLPNGLRRLLYQSVLRE